MKFPKQWIKSNERPAIIEDIPPTNPKVKKDGIDDRVPNSNP